MRIWSLHPKFLDQKGLVALWRESLLAKKILEGKTKGYKNHPQLHRFKNSRNPLANINYYLMIIFQEAERRNYFFDKSKFHEVSKFFKMPVTTGQIEYEMNHLMNKLKQRDYERYLYYKDLDDIETHPIFFLIEGDIEDWEKIKNHVFEPLQEN